MNESGSDEEEATRSLPVPPSDPTPDHPPAPHAAHIHRIHRRWIAFGVGVLVSGAILLGLVALVASPLSNSELYLLELWGAFDARMGAVTVTPTPAPTLPALSLPPRPDSPQGCVNGQAPIAKSNAIIVSAAGPAQGAPRGVPTTTPTVPPAVAHEVALTFDDGPNPVWTLQVLADLQAAGMHATFFPIGTHAQTYPALVEQEWQAGMAIGNHTLRHNHLLLAQPLAVRANLAQAATILTAAMHDPCLWLFRPPFGVLAATSGVANEIRSEGYIIVNWDTEGHDWTRPGAAVIAQRVIANLHPGAIILLHDGAPDTELQDRSQTVQALPQILTALKARGLVSVTLPRLLRDSGLVTPRVPAPRPTPNAYALALAHLDRPDASLASHPTAAKQRSSLARSALDGWSLKRSDLQPSRRATTQPLLLSCPQSRPRTRLFCFSERHICISVTPNKSMGFRILLHRVVSSPRRHWDGERDEINPRTLARTAL